MSKSGSRAMTVMVALAMLLSTGCGGEAPLNEDAAVSISEQVVEVAERLAVWRARFDVKVAECMAAEGFRSFPRSSRAHLASLRELFSIDLSAVTRDAAAAEGYGQDEVSALSAQEYAYFEGMDERTQGAYSEVHLGEETLEATTPGGTKMTVSVGGCVGGAAAEVYGSKERYRDVEALFVDIQMLGGHVMSRADQREDVRAALAAWTDCMGGHGHDYSTPLDARQAGIEAREGTTRLTEREVAIATADADCQEQTELGDIYRMAILQEQTRLVAESSRLFLAWAELNKSIDLEAEPTAEAHTE